MKFEIKETSEQFNKERLERLYLSAIDPNFVPGWVTCSRNPDEALNEWKKQQQSIQPAR